MIPSQFSHPTGGHCQPRRRRRAQRSTPARRPPSTRPPTRRAPRPAVAPEAAPPPPRAAAVALSAAPTSPIPTNPPGWPPFPLFALVVTATPPPHDRRRHRAARPHGSLAVPPPLTALTWSSGVASWRLLFVTSSSPPARAPRPPCASAPLLVLPGRAGGQAGGRARGRRAMGGTLGPGGWGGGGRADSGRERAAWRRVRPRARRVGIVLCVLTTRAASLCHSLNLESATHAWTCVSPCQTAAAGGDGSGGEGVKNNWGGAPPL